MIENKKNIDNKHNNKIKNNIFKWFYQNKIINIILKIYKIFLFKKQSLQIKIIKKMMIWINFKIKKNFFLKSLTYCYKYLLIIILTIYFIQ